MHRTFGRTLALIALSAISAFAADNGKRVFKVMTRNADSGTDFGYVLAGVPNAVALTFSEIVASNIPARAARLADEIMIEKPDLIGLQEVSRWARLSPQLTPVEVLDQLQSLLSALQARQLRYEVVAVNELADVTQPLEIGGGYVNILDRDVVLAKPELRISNVQTNTFAAYLPLDSSKVVHGWITADVNDGGKTFRFVNTHLESVLASIQMAQASELIQALQNTTLPVVLLGDFNSDASGSPFAIDKTDTVRLLGLAGYTEVWKAVHPYLPGFTWPLFLEDHFPAPPFTVPSLPFERIDLVFVRGPIGIRSIQRTGLFPPYGSDHAGVVATLDLQP